MRRRGKLCLCLVMMLLSFSSMKVFAEGESKVVQGKTIFHMPEHTYEAEIQDGKGSITTENGTEVRIEGKDLDGYTLRVVELFEGDEAFTWLQGQTKNSGSLKAAYDVLLEDAEGNFVTPENGFTVTLCSTQKEAGLKVFHVSAQGTGTELKPERTAGKDGETLTIHGTKLDYYTLLKAPAKPGKPAGNDSQQSGTGHSGGSHAAGGNGGEAGTTARIPGSQVKTGDQSAVGLSLLMMLLSILAAVLSIRKLRREGW